MDCGPKLYEQPSNPAWKRLTKEEVTSQLEKTLDLVLSNKHITRFQYFVDDPLVDRETAISRIRSKNLKRVKDPVF